MLDGQHALVTGGGTGIGAAIARRLPEPAVTVTICGRRREPPGRGRPQSMPASPAALPT